MLKKTKQHKILILNQKEIASFQSMVWAFYAAHGRPFAWRSTKDPYAILVSEIMLQQTQTHRVTPKFELWMTEFPNFYALAQAPLRDILNIWQGLGYNRRALFLQKTAQRIVAEFDGKIPNDPGILITLPGIGKNTAGSITAFAFNSPSIFIETNIRAVFIQSFFKDKETVHDADVEALVIQTIDKTNPREWYYALMDYGVELKKRFKNPSRKSAHHVKQSKFEGSNRQVRGKILKLLAEKGFVTRDVLYTAIGKTKLVNINKALLQLEEEGLVQSSENILSIQSNV